MSEKKKRRRWTASEQLRVVLSGLDGSVEVSELCRREGINTTQYYRWKKPCCANQGGKLAKSLARLIQPTRTSASLPRTGCGRWLQRFCVES